MSKPSRSHSREEGKAFKKLLAAQKKLRGQQKKDGTYSSFANEQMYFPKEKSYSFPSNKGVSSIWGIQNLEVERSHQSAG